MLPFLSVFEICRSRVRAIALHRGRIPAGRLGELRGLRMFGGDPRDPIG